MKLCRRASMPNIDTDRSGLLFMFRFLGID